MTNEICIEELDPTVRTYNCLKRAGINTLSEIVTRMESDFSSLVAIRNFNRKCRRNSCHGKKERYAGRYVPEELYSDTQCR